MMVALGNFLFHYRNILFPVFYLLLFVPSRPLFGSVTVAALTGLGIVLLGQAIRVVTIGLRYIIRGGSKRRVYAKDLVTTGMFSHCRNPLYVGNILIIAGMGVMADSLLFTAIVLPAFMFAYQAIVRAEEAFLMDKFGDAFRDYMRDVNRWIPSLSGIGETLSSMDFHGKRVIIREYNSTFIWTVGAVVIVMKNLRALPDRSIYDAAMPWAIAVTSCLAVAYLVVRFLKKSKRLRDD